jgi:hypothetical protein
VTTYPGIGIPLAPPPGLDDYSILVLRYQPLRLTYDCAVQFSGSLLSFRSHVPFFFFEVGYEHPKLVAFTK